MYIEKNTRPFFASVGKQQVERPRERKEGEPLSLCQLTGEGVED